jgi:hypothetical protein
MDTQPPPPGPSPYGPPPPGQPPYGYNNPPGYPPPEPKKSSRTWLYVILGLLGLCVLCGIVGAALFAFSAPKIKNQVESLTRDLQPTLESAASQIETSVPTMIAAATEAAAPTEAGSTQAGPASGLITKITMATGVQGANMDPVGPTTTFGPSDTFHAVVQIQDAPAATKFQAQWFAVDVGSAAQPNTRIEGNEIVSDGSRNLDFSLTPDSKWPAGTYRVEISVDGTLEQTVLFSVK